MCRRTFLRVIGNGEKFCSGCEERNLAAKLRGQRETFLLAALRREDRESRESLDPAPPRSPAPARRAKKKLSRGAVGDGMTIVRRDRRRITAITKRVFARRIESK
jgi:hypothetical protein